MEYKFAYGEEKNPLRYHFGPLISKVIESTSCKMYLELGIAHGDNIHEMTKYCNCCIGVDNVNDIHFNDFEFHFKTTDDFFKDFNRNPNIIFIDASHNFEQVKKDFINSLNCLSEHGIIFLHDTDPVRQEFLNEMACGDSYKIHNWIKENFPELNMITLPISIAGLTMVNREKDRRILKFLK